MRRREFITLLGAAAALPAAAHAQRASGKSSIGVLMTVAESDPESHARVAAFQQGLADLGWKDGQNVRIEYRWSASNSEFIRQYAEELVALAPDVILANGTPAVTALKKITSSIPIVCALVQDPVGLGLVKSLSRPGGNVTGFTFVNPELIGKWIGLIRDVFPHVTRAALIFNPKTTPFFYDFLREIEATRRPAGIELIALPVGAPNEIDAAVNALGKQPGSSLIIPPDPFNVAHIKQIAQLTGQTRLPAVSVYRPFAVEGGLMTYGPDTPDIFRRSAAYVDRILKGTNPAELPVQQPTRFQFIVNLKTAQSFGLTVPPTLLATADEVIE
ncbi:putative ABC transport system substrate-binding protein [Bradyrhizobium erythrophlei]|jgi:putative ABC transport system substrate-binding protein|nr:putative ABC transport system substrate-binding protein [Bradyrhizobium erythrophlei]